MPWSKIGVEVDSEIERKLSMLLRELVEGIREVIILTKTTSSLSIAVTTFKAGGKLLPLPQDNAAFDQKKKRKQKMSSQRSATRPQVKSKPLFPVVCPFFNANQQFASEEALSIITMV